MKVERTSVVETPPVAYERRRGEFLITTEQRLFDLDAIHVSLSGEAYWSLGVPKHVVAKAIENSLCFGLLENGKQIGFARAVTDRATFAWLCDVYVLKGYRGRGLGDWLVASVLEHPELAGLRRIVLVTRDAHELYRRNGFDALQTPERWMIVARSDAYAKAGAGSGE